MQEEDFLEFLCHFQSHTRATPEQKALLILDNHHSHMSLRAIDFCPGSGIVLLSYPPHFSHKLHPLDRSVFGPFKKMVYTFSDTWMREHPGATMSIYDIPVNVRDALPIAATPSNIQAGFRCTGIWPINREIFSDADLAPFYVTDRPYIPTSTVPASAPPPIVSIMLAAGSSSFVSTTSIFGTSSTLSAAGPSNMPTTHWPPSIASTGPHSIGCTMSTTGPHPSTRPPSIASTELPSKTSTMPSTRPPSITSTELPSKTSTMPSTGPPSIASNELPSKTSTMPSTGPPSIASTELPSKTSTMPITGPPSIASTASTVSTASTSYLTHEFSPISLRPFPKAGPRKTTQMRRRTRAILTDTTVRNFLEKEQEKASLSKVKRKVFAGKEKMVKKGKKCTKQNEDVEDENSAEEQNRPSSSKVKPKVSAEKGQNVKKKRKECTKEYEDESEEEVFCIVCLESYSKPKEVWLSCVSCGPWAHMACTDGSDVYECHNCESD
ncbi:hypothetical protein ABVT39_026194 [Epinephelus coioides]